MFVVWVFAAMYILIEGILQCFSKFFKNSNSTNTLIQANVAMYTVI